MPAELPEGSDPFLTRRSEACIHGLKGDRACLLENPRPGLVLVEPTDVHAGNCINSTIFKTIPVDIIHKALHR